MGVLTVAKVLPLRQHLGLEEQELASLLYSFYHSQANELWLLKFNYSLIGYYLGNPLKKDFVHIFSFLDRGLQAYSNGERSVPCAAEVSISSH